MLFFLFAVASLVFAESFTVDVVNLYPESFSYWSEIEDYVFGSVTGLGLIETNGSEFNPSTPLVIWLGVRPSYNGERLLATGLESLSVPNSSFVATFDSEKEVVDFFRHESPYTLFNDVTEDASGAIYVTDSFEGAVYVVPLGGSIELLVQDELLAAPVLSFGADGIEYVAFGTNEYLIVSNCYDGTLLRVDLADSSIGLIEGDYSERDFFFCPDGVRKLDDFNILVVTNNLANTSLPSGLWHLKTKDMWANAEVVHFYELPEDCDAASAVQPFDKSAYVLCSELNKFFASEVTASFDVIQVPYVHGGGNSNSAAASLELLF